MTKFNIILRYIGRYISIFAACCLLSACLGGTVAQQIVRSIATSVADKAMARALDVDEDQPYSNRKTQQTAETYSPTPQGAGLQSASLQATPTKTAQAAQAIKPGEIVVSDYTYAMANYSFAPVKAIAEPLPADVAAEVESPVEVIQSSQLVRVELFNMLIGEEKNAIYEQARLIGATSLPHKREWPMWRVATGAIQGDPIQSTKKTITFLIPPEFGKLPSGAVTMVELASPGELNVARYKAQ